MLLPKLKSEPDLGPVIHKFLIPDPDLCPTEKPRILPESTPALRILGHLW